jgi:short-subunit dehydrogenase
VMARQLAREGARLALLSRDDEDLERVATGLRARGAEVLAVPCDVRERTQVERAVQKVVARFGRVDVLVNNAGVIIVGPLEHMRVADFEEALAVHLWGPLHTTFAVLPYMKESGGGRIVNISSLGGKIGFPHLAAYNASKHALEGFSDSLRAEVAKDNVYVTTFAPGLVRTGGHFQALFRGRHEMEFTWFALLDSLPLLSTSAERMARRILDACRRREASVTFPPHIRAITLGDRLFPNLSASLLAFAHRLLPKPMGAAGDMTKTGFQSRSSWAPSLLTRLADRAALKNNEIKGR